MKHIWIPYGHQWISKNDINEVVKVLNSKWLAQGPNALRFEQALAKYCGAKYAIVVNSGTAALHLAYLVAEIGDGDEVITTPNTFVATTNMLLVVGAKPIFCDIRLDTYNINEKEIEKLITNKTKAIVPVHLAGHSCEMEKIKRIARKHRLKIIEDGCHALGAEYHGFKVGSCKYSDMTVFSFHPVKTITTGEGGAILTNNKTYYKKLSLLRNHGIHKGREGRNIMTMLGYNYRLTDFQSALGTRQIKRINEFIKRRSKIANWYKQELNGFKKIILPVNLPHNRSAWHIYIIRTMNQSRDRLTRYLYGKNIGTNWHYPPVYSHVYYRNHGYNNMKLSNADKYYKTCLTLPVHPRLSRAEVRYICDCIKAFYAK